MPSRGTRDRKAQGGRKPRRQRDERTRILVVTEGEKTEPEYVAALDRFLRGKGATTIVKTAGVGKDPLVVVRKCLELRETDRTRDAELAYDVCICLVDVDTHHTLEAAITLAADQSILALVTNLKFEVWLRWHVEDKRSCLNTHELDALAKKLGLLNGKSLAQGFPIEGVDRACRNAYLADPDLAANRVGPDPSSAMPILVDLMRNGRKALNEPGPGTS